MLFVDVIRAKRDGRALSEEQIAFFVRGLADGSIPTEQVSALAMAICLRSMSFEEAAALTRAMAASGTILPWSAAGSGLVTWSVRSLLLCRQPSGFQRRRRNSGFL